jgi:hypothetical protein
MDGEWHSNKPNSKGNSFNHNHVCTILL